MRFQSLFILTFLAGFSFLKAQKLQLAHGDFESFNLNEVQILSGAPVFLWIPPAIPFPQNLQVLGYYGQGWALVVWEENMRRTLGSLQARVATLSPLHRIHARDPDATLWWVWSPLHSLPVKEFEPLSQGGWYQFKGSRQALNQSAHLPFLWAEPASGKPQPDTVAGGFASHAQGLRANGFGFQGQGVGIQINEDGDVQQHVDFSGRLNENGLNITVPTQDHGDHVAGIATGGGIRDPKMVGVAPHALLWNQGYTTDPAVSSGLFIADSLYAHHGVRVSNTSYSDGCNTGYTAWSRWIDEQVNSHPGLVHVFSAGNAGLTQCGYGAGLGFGTITGGHKQAKNALVVGNVTLSGQLASNSSRGPATDGRLKPDLVAPGVQIPSTSAFMARHGYQTKSGTSMAAPMVAGLAANLMEAYKSETGQFPSAALVRALLMNTAEDLGLPGPDFSFGYGRPQPFEAYAVIHEGTFLQDTLLPSGNLTFPLVVSSGATQLRLMLHYDDVAAGPGALQTLIQDADLRLISPSGTVFLPWVCSGQPSAVNTPATRAQDRVNNTEQITVDAPESGTWTVEVSPHSLPAGPLPFVLVYRTYGGQTKLWYPDSGACLVPGDSLELLWHAGTGTNTFQPEISLNGGQSWQGLGVSVPESKGKVTVGLPTQALSHEVLFRLAPSLALTSRANSVLAGRPTQLTLDSVCGTRAWLSWQGVGGASAYQMWALQGSQMVPWGNPVQGNQVVIDPWNPSQHPWWAVSVAFPDGSFGMRSLAIEAPSVLGPCDFWHDYALTPSIFPVAGPWHYRMDSLERPGKMAGWVLVENRGKSQGETGRLQSNRGLDTLISLPHPGEKDTLKFYDFLYIDTTSQNYTLWLQTPLDEVFWNDSLVFPRFSGSRPWVGEAWPYNMTWSQENVCGGLSPCGNLSCPFIQGWLNLGPGFSDEADWFIHRGSTPSNGTGPTSDAEGNLIGNYIYTEASGCSDKETVLWSPLFQAGPQDTAWVRFHYHMNGSDMGQLEVATVTSTDFTSQVQLSGDQGNQWLTAQFPVRMHNQEAVFFRLRAKTGAGFLSDVAVDDFILDTLPIELQPLSGEALCQWTPGTLTRKNGDLADQWFFSLNGITWQASGPGPHLVPSGSSGILTGYVLAGGQSNRRFYFRYPLVGMPMASFSWTEVGPGQMQFQGVPQEGATWSWTFGDGQVGQGQAITHGYGQNGQYEVKLIVENACGKDSSIQEVVVSNVGISPEEPLPGWLAYPNPFTNQFQLSHPPDISLFSWTLCDMAGRVVRQGQFEEAETSVQIGEISGGLYYFRVLSSAGPLVFRMIKRP